MRFLILLFSVSVFAQDVVTNYVTPDAIDKIHNGESGYSVYRKKNECGNDCVNISDKDPETHVIVGGVLVEDAGLVAAKAAKIQAKQDSQAADKQKRDDAKLILDDLPSANSIVALRAQVQAIKDYLGIE